MACHAGRASKQLLLKCVCHLVQGQNVHGQQEGPNISSLDSAVQQQWEHAANAHPGKIDIKPQSQGRSGGCVISAQMATCTTVKQLSRTGAMAQAVLSAETAKCVSTTPWPMRVSPQGLFVTREAQLHKNECANMISICFIMS